MKSLNLIVSEFSFPHCTKDKQYACSKCGNWSASKNQHDCTKGFIKYETEYPDEVFRRVAGAASVMENAVSFILTTPIQKEEQTFVYTRINMFGGADKVLGRVSDVGTFETMPVNAGNLVITSKDFGVYINQDMTPALIPMSTIEQLVVNYELPLRRLNRFYDN